MNNTTPCQPIGNDDGQYLGALTKKCSKCGEVRPLDGFCRLSRSQDGRYPSCKVCESSVSKAYYEKNRERIKQTVKTYSAKHPEKVVARRRAAYQKDPAAHIAKTTAYARAHREQSNAHKQKWLENNPDKRKEAYLKWQEENKCYVAEFKMQDRAKDPEKYNKRVRAWQKRNRERVARVAREWKLANPGKVRAACSRRRLKMRAMPWVEERVVEALYDEAVQRYLATGEQHEVDHVYPVQGKTVSGLHVPANLQVITREANRAKSNKLPGNLSHELWDPRGPDVYYPEEDHA